MNTGTYTDSEVTCSSFSASLSLQSVPLQLFHGLLFFGCQQSIGEWYSLAFHIPKLDDSSSIHSLLRTQALNTPDILARTFLNLFFADLVSFFLEHLWFTLLKLIDGAMLDGLQDILLSFGLLERLFKVTGIIMNK